MSGRTPNLLDVGETRKESSREKRLRHGRGMRGLQAIISHGARSGETCVNDGGPALETIVMIAVKHIRDTDRDDGRSRFDRCEGRVIVHNLVGQESFVEPAAAKIQCREIIERARSSHGRKQKTVFAIPERVIGR